MLWWAYAGLSASLIVSISSLALLLGMPVPGVARLTVETMVILLAVGLAIHAFAGALIGTARIAKPRPAQRASDALLLLTQRTAKAQAPEKPPTPQRRRNALADLRPERA